MATYTGKDCTGTPTAVTYQWATSSAVALSAPAGPQLIRDPNTAITKTQLLGFSGPPGAISYEIKYAKDATVAADGSLSALAVQDAYLDRATGQVQIIGARDPGTYTAVARAKIGDFATPWSAPVQLQLQQPFDILTGSFTDRRGPSYQLRTTMRDAVLRGSRVTVSLAKGKNGKRFRTLGKPKVNSKGQFKVRFTVRKLGWYRVRYSFKGNAQRRPRDVVRAGSLPPRDLLVRSRQLRQTPQLPISRGMSEFTPTSVRRVAIVEDHGALRIFLRDVLQRYGWKVTGVAGTAETGCELVLTTDPDVAVVDLHLASEGGGDALIRRLSESASTTKVVVFTATTDPTELHEVLKAGADGIVLKEGGLPELLAGLDAVTRGEQYLSPSLA